jgi:hypothetical protein
MQRKPPAKTNPTPHRREAMKREKFTDAHGGRLAPRR